MIGTIIIYLLSCSSSKHDGVPESNTEPDQRRKSRAEKTAGRPEEETSRRKALTDYTA